MSFQIFGSITTMIEAYGGDVVKFVGDAVIAAWYLEHSSDEHAAQAAAHAAVSAAMLMLSQPLVSPAPGHSMSLHCAIDFGVLSELLVGGVDNRRARAQPVESAFGDAKLSAVVSSPRLVPPPLQPFPLRRSPKVAARHLGAHIRVSQ